MVAPKTIEILPLNPLCLPLFLGYARESKLTFSGPDNLGSRSPVKLWRAICCWHFCCPERGMCFRKVTPVKSRCKWLFFSNFSNWCTLRAPGAPPGPRRENIKRGIWAFFIKGTPSKSNSNNFLVFATFWSDATRRPYGLIKKSVHTIGFHSLVDLSLLHPELPVRGLLPPAVRRHQVHRDHGGHRQGRGADSQLRLQAGRCPSLVKPSLVSGISKLLQILMILDLSSRLKILYLKWH